MIIKGKVRAHAFNERILINEVSPLGDIVNTVGMTIEEAETVLVELQKAIVEAKENRTDNERRLQAND